jgi:hypothetical protein
MTQLQKQQKQQHVVTFLHLLLDRMTPAAESVRAALVIL